MAIVPVTIWLNFETVDHQGYARFAVFDFVDQIPWLSNNIAITTS